MTTLTSPTAAPPRTAPVPVVAPAVDTPLAHTATDPFVWGGTSLAEGHLTVTAPLEARDKEILTAEALAFLAMLHDRFADSRTELLLERQRRMRRIADGDDPDFHPATRPVRDDPSWRVAGAAGAPGLSDRRGGTP